MAPQSAAAEAEYNKQYILWAGLVMVRKLVHKAKPLLAGFGEVEDEIAAGVIDRQDPAP